jgi:hypothetical protein
VLLPDFLETEHKSFAFFKENDIPTNSAFKASIPVVSVSKQTEV